MTKIEKAKIYDSLVLENRIRMPELMKSIWTHKTFKFYYGGRGSGKSYSIAKFLLFKANESKVRILCARENQNSIKDSVHSVLSDLIRELDYTNFIVTEREIRHSNGSEFIFAGLYGQDKKQSIKSYSNIDYCHLEEAQAVRKGSLDTLIPTIRNEECEIIFSFNRLKPNDPVWEFQSKIEDENKIVQKINYYENPFCSNKLLKDAARDKARFEKGIDDDYLHTWKGNPVNLSDKAIISLELVNKAVSNIISDEGQIEFGVDLARYGDDRSVFVKRKGMKVLDIKIYKKKDEVEIIELLRHFIDKDKDCLTKIDLGYMPGVYDHMREYGYNVRGINNGSKALDPDRYNNRISEMWFHLKDIMHEIQLPDNEILKDELSNREWYLDNKGRRCVESKGDYKKRHKESPDLADAVLLAFASTNSIDDINKYVAFDNIPNDDYSDFNLSSWES